ncbi:hypothetical protein A9Q99_02755 [Gammaproteobacteria bacterium 45_16_T64]|nr:hypothetical protein A9Q99_02755 [Gammaproteobacteria bacterium 45_16_T64]
MRYAWVVGLCVCVGFWTGHCYGAIVENLTIGNAKALALANAVTADPPGVDSIHFNPAGLALMKGRQRNLKLLAARLTFEVEFGEYTQEYQDTLDALELEDDVPNSSSSTSILAIKIPGQDKPEKWPLPFLIAPLGGAIYNPPGTNVTFGTAVYTPLAAGYVRDEDDPATYMGEVLAISRITYLSPSIGVALSDEWLVGASLGLSYFGLGGNTRLRVPHSLVGLAYLLSKQFTEQNLCVPGVIELCDGELTPVTEAARLEFYAEDTLSFSVNFGVLWKPTPWFSWGAVYQSESENDMKGSYQITYSDAWSSFFGDVYNSSLGQGVNFLLPLPTGRQVEKGVAKISLKTPAHFATGVSVQLTPRWKVNVDAKWTDWAVWGGIVIEFDRPLDFLKIAGPISDYATEDVLTIPRHYESTWNWAYGVEYQWNDALALRFGYEPRTSSIPEDKRDVLLPVGDADFYTAGWGC